uniref:Uncharacterized protein n=1 Tax=Chromera velia CCMP2878 TaxID=1169474 RepID=A0A0G4GYN2_9ALVE|eukprot:Cvel_5421.t1-p1 / transcript=Cvel_5421.t1 / gene=Cvel_5421 / organism=Chromera_velia_CCMP2878 / gene_product=Alpha-1,6-mannosyl-glycoprotein, putative / transcript_product=Alpha-1,6-mannosyl-glycoprotein, putative / location=Cvel_scaffold252:58488-62313(+) / protein_length=613 / sequence_SO=supercontig / SO=protein_coding / is_pseudo=false
MAKRWRLPPLHTAVFLVQRLLNLLLLCCIRSLVCTIRIGRFLCRKRRLSWLFGSRRKVLACTAFSAFVAVCLASFCVVYLQKDLRNRLAHERYEDLQLKESWVRYAIDPLRIRNLDRFPLRGKIVPIVLFVYNRVQYIRQTLEGLKNCTDIQNTLLIVSHDGDEKRLASTYELTRSVDFMPVLELEHPRCDDCVDISMKTKMLQGKHYNHQQVINFKKHWWWMNEIFWGGIQPRLPVEASADFAIFLEDDHVVTPDFYQLLLKLTQLHASVERNSTHPSLPQLDRPSDHLEGLTQDEKLQALLADSWGVAMFPPHKNTKIFGAHEAVPDRSVRFSFGFQHASYCYNRRFWDLVVANRHHFWEYEGGYDVTIGRYLMGTLRLLPPLHIFPAASRVRDIGEIGVTVKTGDDWDRWGSGTMPHSSLSSFPYELRVARNDTQASASLGVGVIRPEGEAVIEVDKIFGVDPRVRDRERPREVPDLPIWDLVVPSCPDRVECWAEDGGGREEGIVKGGKEAGEGREEPSEERENLRFCGWFTSSTCSRLFKDGFLSCELCESPELEPVALLRNHTEACNREFPGCCRAAPAGQADGRGEGSAGEHRDPGCRIKTPFRRA